MVARSGGEWDEAPRCERALRTDGQRAYTRTAMPTRRDFLASSAAGGVFACAAAPPPAEDRVPWQPRLSENVGDVGNETLRWLAQLGHEWVVLQGTNDLDRESKGYWTPADIDAVQEKCARFGLGLHSLMVPLPWLIPAMLGTDDRDASMERIHRSIEAGGRQGVSVFEWRWSPDFKWGADVGYFEEAGRGGAIYKAFDYGRVADAPPFEELGRISRDVLWERLLYFAKPTAAVAEAAGVKLSLHPKDPPVKSMRGVDRVLTNAEEILTFLDAVPSKANGFTFCQGTVTEMGVDVLDAIRRVGSRIHHVHFRAVRGSVPRYTEVFIDEGDVDMLEAMRAYRDVGYQHAIVSDHSPQLDADTPGRRIGRSYSHGYMQALVEVVNAEA